MCSHQRRAETSLTHHKSVAENRILVPQPVCSGPRTFCGPDRGLWIGQVMKATLSYCQTCVPFRNTLLHAAANIQVQGMCLCGDLPWVGLTETSRVHSRPGAKLYESHVAVAVLVLSAFMRQSDSAGRSARGGQDGRPWARRRLWLCLLHPLRYS